MRRILSASLIALVAATLFTAEAQRRAEPARKVPLIYWTQGIESAAALKQAGIESFAVPPESVAAWRKAGFTVSAFSSRELSQREKLLTPRLAGRAEIASATRRPWIDSNGWRFLRKPAGKFLYDLTEKGAGKAALAAAEAFAYQADAVLKIDPADVASTGKMLEFLRALPPANLPPVADIGLIDDGSPAIGEVMNLFTRRNLLFKLVPKPSSQLRLNIKLGSPEFPESDAADPSAFAQKIRHRLGDENRSLRLYGTEIVVARLTAEGNRARLQLLNYGGREVDSIRIRVRGSYGKGELKAFGIEDSRLEDFVVAEDATEFTLTRLGAYAVIEMAAGR